MRTPENRPNIKNNKFLFVATILMLIYSILEMIDSIVVVLIVLNLIPNLTLIFKFSVPLIQNLLETQPLSLAPIFWAFTLMRVISTIGLFKNLLWGLWIGFVNLFITMILAIVFLPFGAIEILACSVILILLIVGFCGDKLMIKS
ncbi:MAG: hypothetical protein ACFFDF_14775 [Candidatus Odinarchaeota archaeon]